MAKFEIKKQDGKNTEIKRLDSALSKKGKMLFLAKKFIGALK